MQWRSLGTGTWTRYTISGIFQKWGIGVTSLFSRRWVIWSKCGTIMWFRLCFWSATAEKLTSQLKEASPRITCQGLVFSYSHAGQHNVEQLLQEILIACHCFSCTMYTYVYKLQLIGEIPEMQIYIKEKASCTVPRWCWEKLHQCRRVRRAPSLLHDRLLGYLSPGAWTWCQGCSRSRRQTGRLLKWGPRSMSIVTCFDSSCFFLNLFISWWKLFVLLQPGHN